MNYEKIRSSRKEVFSNKSVLKKFGKSAGNQKYQCFSFNKVAGPRPAKFHQNRLYCYSVLHRNFTKIDFVVIPSYIEISLESTLLLFPSYIEISLESTLLLFPSYIEISLESTLLLFHLTQKLHQNRLCCYSVLHRISTRIDFVVVPSYIKISCYHNSFFLFCKSSFNKNQ